MNSPQIRDSAVAFAKRLPADDDRAAITHAWRMALGRSPTSDELADNSAFLNDQVQSYQEQKAGNPRELALADICHVLFALNEFIYVE